VFACVCWGVWTRKIFSTLPATIRFDAQYVRIFVLSLLAMENLFPHSWQQKGFSPVCVRMCTVKLLTTENHFPHSCQQKDFSPVCVRMCFVRVLTPENLFPHSLQQNVFSSMPSHVHGQVAGNGKSFSTLLASKKFFLQYVFAYASLECWDQKIFFNTPINKKVFLHNVFAYAWSSCSHRKIFFSTLLATKRFFSRMCS